jgi:hypothetical protein
MKKRIEILKRDGVDNAKKIGMVLLGFIGGRAIAYGLDKLIEKYPDYDTIITASKHTVLAGGGLALTFLTDKEEQELKHLGYGLTIAEGVEGMKLIPIAKDMLGGFGNTYYTESDKPMLELGNFGLNSLPVSSYNMEDAPTMRLELPPLGGSDLGYNPAQNDLGYNPAQNDLGYSSSITDDISGIL